MVVSIESKILSEYPGLILNKNLPVVLTDDMLRVGSYVLASRLFDTLTSELFVASILEFFKPYVSGVFFRTDRTSTATSDGAARKHESNRVVHCFSLTYWGNIGDDDVKTMLDDIIYAIQETEISTDRGMCFLRTAIGDKYILTQGVSIETAFPTKYYRELMRLGYDVHYIDFEKDQLAALKQLAEAKNEEVLKGTSH